MEKLPIEIIEIYEQSIIKSILKNCKSSSVLHKDDTMTKYINGQFIRKQCARKKDWSYDWIENIKEEEIDDIYFNSDYSRKITKGENGK